MKERINIHDYFLKIAEDVSERSTCIRHKIGCIFVLNGQILSTGYNGAAKGLPHCIDIGCIRNELNINSGEHQEICAAIHAEQNAIINAAKHGISIKNAICYCNFKPCTTCMKMLINVEIKEIHYKNDYVNNDMDKYIKSSGIKIIKH